MNIEKINAPDAILRPDIDSLISEYMSTGGKAESLPDLFSQNYIGLIHKIIFLGKILESLGLHFQKSFEKCMRKWVVTHFVPSKFDQYVEDVSNLPQWAIFMCSNNFWAKVIIDLMNNFPNSKFVSYLFLQICSQNPQIVQKLPPFFSSFECFLSTFQYYLSSVSDFPIIPDNPNLKTLINIIKTDDVTLGYVALGLNPAVDSGLIKNIYNSLSGSQKKLFFSIILEKVGIPYQLRCFLTSFLILSQDSSSNSLVLSSQSSNITNSESKSQAISNSHFTTELSEPIISACANSTFINELCIKHLSTLLLDDQYNDEEANQIGQVLSTITKSNDVSQAISYVRNSKYTLLTFPVIYEAIQIPFFASSLLPHLIKEIKSTDFRKMDTRSSDSPQTKLLKEIAYFYPSFRGKIFVGLEEALIIKRGGLPNEIGRLRADLFNTVQYIGKLGFLILDIFSNDEIDLPLRLQQFARMLNEAMHPFDKKWLHEIRIFIEKNKKFIYPPNGEKPTGSIRNLLESLRSFIIKINRNVETGPDADDIEPYDKICRTIQMKLERV